MATSMILIATAAQTILHPGHFFPQFMNQKLQQEGMKDISLYN